MGSFGPPGFNAIWPTAAPTAIAAPAVFVAVSIGATRDPLATHTVLPSGKMVIAPTPPGTAIGGACRLPDTVPTEITRDAPPSTYAEQPPPPTGHISPTHSPPASQPTLKPSENP